MEKRIQKFTDDKYRGLISPINPLTEEDM